MYFINQNLNQMARIKIEQVVDRLDSELRKALEATVKEHFPNQSFDQRAVYRTFKKQVARKCNYWENVPDNCIEKD